MKVEFEDHLSEAIDPFCRKVMRSTGREFVDDMSYEMRKWIKDSSILWIKNQGAGNTTTEYELTQQEQHLKYLMLINQQNKELTDLRKHYRDLISDMK